MRAPVKGVVAVLVGCLACTPALTQDGQLVFSPGSSRGASILTANGIEIVDRSYVPEPRVRASAAAPWVPAAGFLLPPDGIWREVSKPLRIRTPRLTLVARASDAIVPSWGGELLMRLDASVPSRSLLEPGIGHPTALVVVIADRSGASYTLTHAALQLLKADDWVSIIDADGQKTVLPLIPCSHRTLVLEALRSRLRRRNGGDPSPLSLPDSLAQASAILGTPLGTPAGKKQLPFRKRVLLLTDGRGLKADLSGALDRLDMAGMPLVAISTDDELSSSVAPPGLPLITGTEDERVQALPGLLSQAAPKAIDDLSISVEGLPGPTHILETSGGALEWGLTSDTLHWSGMRVGEGRTEVIRVALPVWTPQEPFELTLTVNYRDHDTGQPHAAAGKFVLRFSDDILRLSEDRHGDVLAYASALAMVSRLSRAFWGDRGSSVDGFRDLVQWQARSMFDLAQQLDDPAMKREGEVLDALLAALPAPPLQRSPTVPIPIASTP